MDNITFEAMKFGSESDLKKALTEWLLNRMKTVSNT